MFTCESPSHKQLNGHPVVQKGVTFITLIRDTEVHHLVFMKSRELDSIILWVPIDTKPFKPTKPIILLNITYTVLAFLFVWCHKSPFLLDLHTSTAPAPCHTAPHQKPPSPGTEGCRRCCCCWCICSPRSSASAAGKRTSLKYQRRALLEEGSCWALNHLLSLWYLFIYLYHLFICLAEFSQKSSECATQVAWGHGWTWGYENWYREAHHRWGWSSPTQKPLH